MPATPIDFGPAILQRTRPDLVVMRFKPGAIADAACFRQGMVARRTHSRHTPHALLVVGPAEIDFSPDVLSRDHYKDEGVEDFTKAAAIVCPNPGVARVMELYYALYPAPFPVMFFEDEENAMRWVNAQLAQPIDRSSGFNPQVDLT